MLQQKRWGTILQYPPNGPFRRRCGLGRALQRLANPIEGIFGLGLVTLGSRTGPFRRLLSRLGLIVFRSGHFGSRNGPI